MDLETILARIVRDPRLPTPPAVALRVLEKASRPDCALTDIAKLISHDPSLCAKLLKIVNSAFFNLPGKVRDIGRASSLLGIKRIRALVLGLSLPSMQRRTASDSSMSDHWKVSIATAIAAREWAVFRRNPDADSEMVAALLCDLGALVLREIFPESYHQLLSHPIDNFVCHQCELEEKLIGVDHAEVGAHLLRLWGLPDEITQAIRYHHRPADSQGQDTVVVERAYDLHFASLIGQLQLAPREPSLVSRLLTLAAERFEMDQQQLEQFLEPLHLKIEEFAALINVPIGSTLQYPALLASATEQLAHIASETALENIRIQEAKEQADQLLQQSEEALRRSEEQLRQAQKMEAIGQLAGGVAHDFNNLLTIISGYSDLLLNGLLGPQDAAREAVLEIRKAAERAATLTRQLLAFSRRQVLTPQVLVLNSVVQDMDKMLRRLICEDIQLTSHLADNLDPVKADPGQIEQVLLNLAVNARDAMPQGGRLTIETANVVLDETYTRSHPGLRPGPFVMLAVTDTGCGMDAATQARIFEPFFTTKGPGKGTGLGLATVYGIVKQSGGSIYVYSEVGHGTSFKVYLPRTDETLAPPVRPAESTPLSSRAGGQETLLIVEDDDSVRALTRTVLRGQSYHVVEAVDADEALRWVEEHTQPIHLLVTDVVMPGMSGRALAERLTALRPELKVLYVSGYTDDAVVRHGLLEAEIAFLQKPFTPASLARKVRELLDQ
ncbi:MAG TPA: HDOD domain-containing protein [Gemmataceae bacterium]|nr:HDOD domain-containing protein [Gemmataceae bacterium]